MKISTKINGEWFLIPCNNEKLTVGWLGTAACEKYSEHFKNILKIDSVCDIQEIRKINGNLLLDPDVYLKDVLEDYDCVHVVLVSDTTVPKKEVLDEKYNEFETTRTLSNSSKEVVMIDGNNLDIETFMKLGSGNYEIQLSKETEVKILKSRKIIEDILTTDKSIYGINTGIGNLMGVAIPFSKLQSMQYNVIRSHAAGVGKSLNPARALRLLALRINVLAKGYSGISLETLQGLIKAFNASCVSYIPEQGSVGASGDLAPLSHLAMGMIGEGLMWSHKTGWAPAGLVLEVNGLEPLKLKPKEGVALINGTQLITSLGAEAVDRALRIALQADVVAALSIEVLRGSVRPFDSDIHFLRPHSGQIAVAERLRALLHSKIHPSEITESHEDCKRVQDSYSLRCCPQVHGIVHDTIEFVQKIINTEMNSATDNPIVLPIRNEIISGGNFHGEYPAKALDYLGIAIHEIASISERRIERLVNPAYSGLPAFLVPDSGVSSGFMVTHCTAAALVSENKVLTHPSSVDSINTSGNQEDHVSMGCFSARKALKIVENVENVISIELLAACQAMEFLRPLKTTAPLEKVYSEVRKVVSPLDTDRFMAPDIEAARTLLVENKIWKAVEKHIDYYNSAKVIGNELQKKNK